MGTGLCLSKCFCFCRANGHDVESLNTFAVISSVCNAAWALGAMLGPPAAGAMSQYMGFPWATTATAFIQSFVVRIVFVDSLKYCLS